MDIYLDFIPALGEERMGLDYRKETFAVVERIASRGFDVHLPHGGPGVAPVVIPGHFVIELLHTVGSLGLGGLIGAWLQAKNGRKVRLRVGGVEAEAQTVEEVEKLLKRAEEIQEHSQPKVIHEP